MSISVLSPCLHCDRMLPGVSCGPRKRSHCSRFLDYIQNLHRIKASRILIRELKELIVK